MLLHRLFNYTMYFAKSYPSAQKCRHGYLIGAIQHSRHRTAFAQSIVGQRQRRKALLLHREETQLALAGKIQRPPTALKPVWKRQGIGDRYAHVGNPQLSDDRSILISDHRMNHALR